ncbi:hypothetical protein B2G71_07150 [Novosphingobium sp. PC22D]|uniref:DUF6976 family protein n=1 Tax=Novosphingobium sp. PC22D TaxID=1962403 RepID=UPI000BFAC48E|nr:hypothetical protein [Novosphingobium sp. PC22D]PEQ13212.1 hypothetical protein B2G71_07150 [Novosphingobium sp. PC22D]
MSFLSSTGFDRVRVNAVLPLGDVVSLIAGGATLCIAGHEDVLRQLPAGQWIGGTTPYVMTAAGGAKLDHQHLFVTELGDLGETRVAHYGPDEMEKITANTPDGGFALTVIPAGSRCHERFAHDAANYPQAFLKPTFGWIAGHDLDQPGASAKVFAGSGEAWSGDRAAVLHVALPEDVLPHLEFVNLFEPDRVETIRFHQTTFAPARAMVNGAEVDFADYVRSRGLEHGQLPLVGDYSGAYVNASLQEVEAERVRLYAPVFPGVDYCFARPIGDYAEAFAERLAQVPSQGTLFSCNCILNYQFGDLAGKAIGGFGGPITFGEIAFQLHNQTLIEVRLV